MIRLELGYPNEVKHFNPEGQKYLLQSEMPNNSYHVLINDTGVLTDPWIKLKLEGTFTFDKALYFTHDYPNATTALTLMEI